MRMKWGVYAGVSTALAGGVILKALAQRPNFYSATVYLAQSSANLMILTNLIFVTACAALFALQKVLYGPLRPIEIEQLYEKAWFAVTETCLAMTIFRGEIGGWFLVMFFSLLTGKVWGWIGEGRVEILEQQPPANPRLFHTRLAFSLILSVLFDTWMLEYIVKQVLHMARPDMMVMFGFEFAVLTILSLSSLARYGISLVEILIIRGQKFRRAEEIRRERREAAEAERRAAGAESNQESTASDGQPSTPSAAAAAVEEPIDESEIEVEGWEEKGRWVFYLDLTTDFFKLVVYMSFFFILLVFYGLPIHIMRDVFLTCRSFAKRIADFIRYRTATRDMNERYPDATPEEIGREDVCIICREEMRPMPPANQPVGGDAAAQQQQPPRPRNPVAERMRPKKLPCGHVLHFSCLRSWLERQQICPTCRRPVIPSTTIRIGAPGANAAPAPGFGQGFADGAAAARANLGQNQGPGQAAQGNRNANANGNGNPDPGDGQNQNRARIFQFGPLRIGIGAGRGNMFEDLAQQIQDARAPRMQNQNGAVNPNAPQQYGIGFGIGRANPGTGQRDTGGPSTTGQTLTDQIDRLHGQISQEISGLSIAAQELNTVRELQRELTRLRELRNSVESGTTSRNGQVAIPQLPGVSTILPTAPTSLVVDRSQNLLEAGSPALPEGLTLPPGWTMMPLQRVQPAGQPPVNPALGQQGAFGHSPALQASQLGHRPVNTTGLAQPIPRNGIPQVPQVRSPPPQANLARAAAVVGTAGAEGNDVAGMFSGYDRTHAVAVGQGNDQEHQRAHAEAHRRAVRAALGDTAETTVNGDARPTADAATTETSTTRSPPQTSVPPPATNQPPLPTWGTSTPLVQPVATGATVMARQNGDPPSEPIEASSSEKPQAGDETAISSTIGGDDEADSSHASAPKKTGKPATVEDLVEGPD